MGCGVEGGRHGVRMGDGVVCMGESPKLLMLPITVMVLASEISRGQGQLHTFRFRFFISILQRAHA